MEEDFKSLEKDTSGLSVKEVFFKYVRFLPFFVLSVAISLLVAYVYLRYATPIYSSTGTLLIKNELQGGADEKFADLFGSEGKQNIQNDIEVLRSKSLMERVVHALQLEKTYYAIGKIKSPNVYTLAPFRLEVFELADSSQAFSLHIQFENDDRFTINNGDRKFEFNQVFRNRFGVFRLMNSGISGGKDYLVTWTPTHSVASGLAGNINIAPKTPGTGILLISLEATNPMLAGDVINQLMMEYDSVTLDDKNTNLSNTLKFIDGRLDVLNHELDSIQRVLLDFREKNNLIDVPTQSAEYFQRVSDADKEINEQRLKLEVVRIIEDYLSNAGKQYSKVPSSLGLDDATLNTLIGAYNQLQIERKRLIDGNTPGENLVVKEKDQQIEKLRENILESLGNIRKVYENSIRELMGKSTNSQASFKSLPAKTKQMMEIERQEQSKLTLYELLMGKREETAIAKAATISNSKIVERARPNTTPVKPTKSTIQLMAVLIGLAIPALVLFISEISNDKIRTRNDIERVTSAPVLGEVGHSYSENTLIVTTNSRSMVAEQFRIIRSNLQYVINKIEKPTFLTTSSFSGEGKSFITTNIGAVMSLAGKKTIILEFDIRKPKILTGLGMTKKPGITNFILGKNTLDELILPVPGYEHFYVLSCGPVPPNPSELLLEETVADLFAQLKARFDVVLIDTAPVGMVSDALTLSKFADATLYIVRQEHTFKKQVHLIDELYKQERLPRISVVINDVKLKPGYGYYGYGRYGYGYGYGEGYYEENVPAPSFLDRILSALNPLNWFRNKK